MCLVTVKQIEELFKASGEKSLDVFKAKVENWQNKTGRKDKNDYPVSVEELESFRRSQMPQEEVKHTIPKPILSAFNTEVKTNKVDLQKKVDLDYTTITRRDRVNYVARLFSLYIDQAIKKDTSELNRKEIIKRDNPQYFFKQIYDSFNNYLKQSPEQNIQIELNKINQSGKKATEERKLEVAKQRVEHNREEYKKLLDNFTEIAQESTFIIARDENIKIDIDGYVDDIDTKKEDKLEDSGTDALNQFDDNNTSLDFEEKYKEGWMSDYSEVSSESSHAQEVRKLIGNIFKINHKGSIERDDLNQARYLNPSMVHAILIKELKNMDDVHTMYKTLEKMSKRRKWVMQIIKTLQSDNQLETLFFIDFRKDHQVYTASLVEKQKDGTLEYKTKYLNVAEGSREILNQWRQNTEAGNILDDKSIYNTSGEINRENAQSGLKWTQTLQNVFNPISLDKKLELLKEDKYFKTIVKLLNMIGVDADPSLIYTALTDENQDNGAIEEDPIITTFLKQLNTIFSEVGKGAYKVSSTGEVDLISNFSGVYKKIADILKDYSETSYESSVRESGKTRYAHTTPNYLGQLVKDLKNVNPDREISQSDKEKYGTVYNKFLTERYKQYDWFFKDGEWQNQWLEDLENDKEVRDNFKYTPTLKHNNLEYSSWDSLDVITVLLSQYNAPLNTKKSNKYANYHMPIYSDTASAEFITQKKYVDGSERDTNGRRLTFEQSLTPKFIKLISQEYHRIMLVRARDEAMQDETNLNKPLHIGNFDIVRDEEGKIKNMGGAEFKFLPALNDVKFDGKDDKGNPIKISFQDKMNEIASKDGGKELQSFLEEHIQKIMNDGFQDTLNSWEKNGLLRQTDKGKFVHFKDISSREDVERFLKEYYWNSKFATSQIIQITTTDLAFYKNLEDFQKRFKQLHAPALRLNTNAKFKNVPIGKEFEKSVYFKDDIIKSNAFKELEDITNAQFTKGFLTSMDRDAILNKYKEINVSDAQSYRSLPSYRQVKIMAGEWRDEVEEKAYQNIVNGIWDISDFNVIFQTIKPYVYTVGFVDSMIEGKGGIPVPVQHKNSEFPLLAIHEMMSSGIGKSPILKAINRFMIDADIDVLHSESVVKAGKQGVIDINGMTDENKIYDYLIAATKTDKEDHKKFDPQVVHVIPYKDYGIQVATPEHAIDKEQFHGTQIRKLIVADISPEAIITVAGKTFDPIKDTQGRVIKTSKDQIIELYNNILTENVLDSYNEAKKLFGSNKKIEKRLLSEVRGNPRYGSDMVRAVTLDKNGEFHIPLFDPIQTQRIQSLLNSIIKNTITKQKGRGGALIQVSNYGLTKELNVRYTDKEGRFIFNKEEWEGTEKHNQEYTKDLKELKKIYSSFEQYKATIKTGAIAYHECYMPAYSRDFYDILKKSGLHEMDIDKLPLELRKIVGYRVKL